jgi:hypothetical protein
VKAGASGLLFKKLFKRLNFLKRTKKMKNTNLIMSFFTLLALSLLGSGCGGGRTTVVVNPAPTPTPTPTICPAWGCNGPPIVIVSDSASAGSSGYSDESGTRDVFSMRVGFEKTQFDGEALQLATAYSLNIDAARQLTQLSDKMTELQAKAGGMTAEDQAAITDAALGVAGITTDEVNAATTQAIQHKDMTAVNTLLAKGAANTGTTVAILRDQILPSLGLNLGSLGQ